MEGLTTRWNWVCLGELQTKESKVAVAKVIELISRSPSSFDDAISKGVETAGESVENIQSAWVKDQQVMVSEGSISEYRVTLKITFLVK